MCGVIPDREGLHKPPTLFHAKSNYKDLPKDFDSRVQWPDCPTIQEVRDQGACGSCWVRTAFWLRWPFGYSWPFSGVFLLFFDEAFLLQAFGAVEAISDRICIHSNSKNQVHVSAIDLVSCCHLCGFG
jgi:cathepsin B